VAIAITTNSTIIVVAPWLSMKSITHVSAVDPDVTRLGFILWTVITPYAQAVKAKAIPTTSKTPQNGLAVCFGFPIDPCETI